MYEFSDSRKTVGSLKHIVKKFYFIKLQKEAFGQLESGVPKIKDLNHEYSDLLKKKNAYAEYRRIKEENKELQMAKHNLERFLNQQEEEQKQKEKQQSKSGQSL